MCRIKQMKNYKVLITTLIPPSNHMRKKIITDDVAQYVLEIDCHARVVGSANGNDKDALALARALKNIDAVKMFLSEFCWWEVPGFRDSGIW